MVAHLINFPQSEWEAAKEARVLTKKDNMTDFVREAVREKVARVMRSARAT